MRPLKGKIRRVGGGGLESNGLQKRIHCIFFCNRKAWSSSTCITIGGLSRPCPYPFFLSGLVDWRRGYFYLNGVVRFRLAVVSVALLWVDCVDTSGKSGGLMIVWRGRSESVYMVVE